MNFPSVSIPIKEIPVQQDVKLFIKREDLIHPEVSGNKFWKLFYNINSYLEKNTGRPQLITFGGAYSNHIAAVAALGNELDIPTVGIIRGEELVNHIFVNPTLSKAYSNGMTFRFVTRSEYRNKQHIEKQLLEAHPNSLIIPEGGTNSLAVEGIRHMLNNETKDFDYLCSAVGTGGTVAGLSKYAADNQKVIGLKVVDDHSLSEIIMQLSGRNNFILLDAHEGGYGKITDDTVAFINRFYEDFGIALDPVYTGKIMKKVFEMIESGFFPEGSRILTFHTGGLQGIEGANELLKKQNRQLIKI